jgi:hypothetical protein
LKGHGEGCITTLVGLFIGRLDPQSSRFARVSLLTEAVGKRNCVGSAVDSLITSWTVTVIHSQLQIVSEITCACWGENVPTSNTHLGFHPHTLILLPAMRRTLANSQHETNRSFSFSFSVIPNAIRDAGIRSETP